MYTRIAPTYVYAPHDYNIFVIIQVQGEVKMWVQ